MGRAGQLLGDNALDFAQLFHEVGLRMQAARRVDYEHISAARASCFDRVEHHGARVGSRLVADHGGTYALSPYLELVDSGSPESISRPDDHALPLVAVELRELSDGGGLTDA